MSDLNEKLIAGMEVMEFFFTNQFRWGEDHLPSRQASYEEILVEVTGLELSLFKPVATINLTNLSWLQERKIAIIC